MKVLFLTVTDYGFFPGTLATVNSVRRFHPEADLVVIENNLAAPGLSGPQIRMLQQGGATLRTAAEFRTGARIVRAWELKAYGAADLAGDYDVLVGIDSDCVLCGPIADVIEEAARSGCFLGGKDGTISFGGEFSAYGIVPGAATDYMSTSLYVCPVSPETREVLGRWAECCAQALFNGGGPYAGHGDQGVLNAVLSARWRGERVRTLENALWSQHWRYWSDVLSFEAGRLVNKTWQSRPQRSLHCGGSEKFWLRAHSERLRQADPCQMLNYAWWLGMFWFGACSDWSLDPLQYLAAPAAHLLKDLFEYFHTIAYLLPEVREHWQVEDPMLSRLLDAVPGAMSVGSSLSEYAWLAGTLPEGSKLVEVGSYEGRSIVGVMLANIHKDLTGYSVESFSGSLNGTMDGSRLPIPATYYYNTKMLYPNLRLATIPGRSPAVARSFADGTLDMVFIDGGHETEQVRADIRGWRPKLKPGGILAGDDWGWESVQRGVRAELGEPCVSPSGSVWWLNIGRSPEPEEERRHNFSGASVQRGLEI